MRAAIREGARRRRSSPTFLFGTFWIAFAVLSPAAYASDSVIRKNLGATLGASYEIGALGNKGMALRDRTMTAVSFEALLGYRWNTTWLVGLDFNYRMQQQQTSLGDAGGTNLRGQGFLLALGAQYRLNEKWAIQGALDLLGTYNFERPTSNAEDDHLEAPQGLRVKAQRFVRDQWSVDASAGLHTWRTFQVSSVSHSKESNQWMIGAGVTYHFDGRESGPPPVVATPPPQQEVVQVFETEKMADGYRFNIPSAAFATGKAELTTELRAKVVEAGRILAKNPQQKILVKGHTDSVGRTASNDRLSQARADTVKAALIEGGVADERIQTSGVGSREPVASNDTPEGRQQNRRVEIIVQDRGGAND